MSVPAEGLFLDGLRLTLGGETLAALSHHIPPGAVLMVMGPSGAGKSTLIAHLAGLTPPEVRAEGRIWLNGRDITARPAQDRRMGLVLQDGVLFPHMSVGQNLAFALPPTLRGNAARRARVAEALRSVGLAGAERRDPATLSGGQRMRVALLRALLAEPEALLLDEPFAALDQALRAQIRETLFDRAAARRLPVVLVSHDASDAPPGAAVVTL